MSEGKFKEYNCAVVATDIMRAYVTDAEGRTEYMAFVLTNAQGQKISVLLTLEETKRLQKQLNTFTNLN